MKELSIEEKAKAYDMALENAKHYHSEVGDEWCEPDGNIDHCISKTYPLSEWFEAKHLSTDLAQPQVIIEDHYSE